MIWQWLKWPKMVYVIKDTVDIYYFCKNWYETAQELPAFQAVSSFFDTNQELLHFSLKTAKNFSNSKPWPSRQRKLGENLTLQAVWTCESLGVPRGDGQAWNYNWLIHYLVLTIWVHFSDYLSIFLPRLIYNCESWSDLRTKHYQALQSLRYESFVRASHLKTDLERTCEST